MKKCRHCGIENQGEALICSECGLDLGPSAAARLIAKLPSAIGAANARWFWRVSLALGLPFLVLVVYMLSLGPILRFYGAKPFNKWGRVPAAVRILYEPQDRMPIPDSLGRVLRRYNQWWMGVERDKREFRRVIAQIDSSITNGMEQSRVIGLLGQPVGWFTNANRIEAYYFYWSDVEMYGGYMTNGFVIYFSNGVVSSKSPIIGGR